MVAGDFPSLLRDAALAHEHLLQENDNLRKENEWLSGCLSGNVKGAQSDEQPCRRSTLTCAQSDEQFCRESTICSWSTHVPVESVSLENHVDVILEERLVKDLSEDEVYPEDHHACDKGDIETLGKFILQVESEGVATDASQDMDLAHVPISAPIIHEASLKMTDGLVMARAYEIQRVPTSRASPSKGFTGGIPVNREEEEPAKQAGSWEYVSYPSVSNTSHMSQKWYIGAWVDLTGSFFNGAVIDLREKDWEPNTVKKGFHKVEKQVTRYSTTVDQDTNTISLLEHRADGEVRVFKAKAGPEASDTLIIWVESNRDLMWTLNRSISQKSISNIYAKQVNKAMHDDSTTPALTMGTCKINYRMFRLGMCLVIMCSLVSFGMQVEFSCPGHSATSEVMTTLLIIDICALICFILEIVVLNPLFGSQMKRSWYAFHMLVTVLDAVSIVARCASEEQYLTLRCVVVLRAVRLVRVAQYFREFESWNVAWQLVYGLLSNAHTVISMFVLLLLLLYIFACIGLTFILDSDAYAKHPSIIDTRFDGVPATMLTLFQFVTTDGVTDEYISLIKASPFLLIYFSSLFLLVSIALMNMVTGVIVEGAMQMASDRREERRHLELTKVRDEGPTFEQIFANIEKKDTHVVCREEFEILDHEKFPECFQRCLTDFQIGSMAELFDILDDQCGEEITATQFVTGMLSLRLAALRQEPHQLVAIHKLARYSALRSRIIGKTLFAMDAQQQQSRLVREL